MDDWRAGEVNRDCEILFSAAVPFWGAIRTSRVTLHIDREDYFEIDFEGGGFCEWLDRAEFSTRRVEGDLGTNGKFFSPLRLLLFPKRTLGKRWLPVWEENYNFFWLSAQITRVV